MQPYAQTVPAPTKRPLVKIIQTSKPGPIQQVPTDSACFAKLAERGVVFTYSEPITDEHGCGIAQPVVVSALSGGITLNPVATLNCETALTLADYTKMMMVPAAKRYKPDTSITGLAVGASYVCRTRNSQAGTKISEHGIGNAIDISAIGFADGTRMAIAPRERKGSAEEVFQKAIQFGACQYFTTVLGPGSDAYHDDHLHFDIAQRRSGYRLCPSPKLANSD